MLITLLCLALPMRCDAFLRMRSGAASARLRGGSVSSSATQAIATSLELLRARATRVRCA